MTSPSCPSVGGYTQRDTSIRRICCCIRLSSQFHETFSGSRHRRLRPQTDHRPSVPGIFHASVCLPRCWHHLPSDGLRGWKEEVSLRSWTCSMDKVVLSFKRDLCFLWLYVILLKRLSTDVETRAILNTANVSLSRHGVFVSSRWFRKRWCRSR